jgi:hypothetical protein
MKRYFLAIAFLSLTTLGFMQVEIPRDPDSKKFSYTEVVNLDTTSQKTMFSRAVSWFETKFKTQSLDLKNEGEGKVSHKGSFPASYKYMSFVMEVSILYNVTISVKDGKYKYEFTDFNFSSSNQGTTSTRTLESYDEMKGQDKTKKQIYEKVDTEVKSMIEDIKKTMSGLKTSNGW